MKTLFLNFIFFFVISSSFANTPIEEKSKSNIILSENQEKIETQKPLTCTASTDIMGKTVSVTASTCEQALKYLMILMDAD